MSALPDDLDDDLLMDVFGGAPPQSCARTKKRGRGIGKDSRLIRDYIRDVLIPAYDRMTVRQCFYQLASNVQLVEKSEAGYRKVQHQVLKMRREGELDWDFITDGTRWMRRPAVWESKEAALRSWSEHYRRDLWQDQGVRIEIWLEKDALAGVVMDVTSAWGVALMVSRGQPSSSYLYSAAKTAELAYEKAGIVTYLYTLYDHDPAGVLRAHPAVAQDIPAFVPNVPIHVTQLAVNPTQIGAWDLPTRPPKKNKKTGLPTDSQSKAWGNRPNVELDAIDPNQLNELVEDAIKQHVDPHKWRVQEAFEAEERKGLELLAGLGDDDDEDAR